MPTFKDNSLYSLELEDPRGIKYKVTNVLECNSRKSKVELSFENGCKRYVTMIQFNRNLQRIKSGGFKNGSIRSIIMPNEFIGKTYNDKTKTHTGTIIKVVKPRYAYLSSIVLVRWDTGLETQNMLSKIMYSKIPFRRLTKRSTDDMYKRIKMKETKMSVLGGYCKIPDNDKGVTCMPIARTKWRSMLKRVNDKDASKSYKKVRICDEWLNFYNFSKWYDDNYVEEWVLDKDIKGGLSYSPETCIFIPLELNAAITMKPISEEYPVGIYKTNLEGRKPYVCSLAIRGRTVNCDYHNDILSAFVIYKIMKEYSICKLVNKLFPNVRVGTKEWEIVSLCEIIEIHDVRTKSVVITDQDVINFLKSKTRLETDNYRVLKFSYIKDNREFFEPRMKLIDDTLDIEFKNVVHNE